MKQSIISIGMTACCLSGNGQSLFAANKPAKRDCPFPERQQAVIPILMIDCFISHDVFSLVLNPVPYRSVPFIRVRVVP